MASSLKTMVACRSTFEPQKGTYCAPASCPFYTVLTRKPSYRSSIQILPGPTTPIFMFNCLNYVVENTLYHMDAVENIIPKLPGREAGREGSRGQTPESAPLVELDPTGVGEQDLAEAILCWGWNHPKLLSILVSCRFFSLCYLGRGGGRRGGRRGRWGRGASWVFFQCIRRILYRAATCAGRLDFAPLHLPSSVCGSMFIDTRTQQLDYL